MEQKLIYINLKELTAIFYNVKIEKNKEGYYVIVSTGKFGNKGTTSIVYKGENYSKSKNEFWKRVNDHKVLGFRKLDDVQGEIDNIFAIDTGNYLCEICGKDLGKNLYNKINNYLRNEVNIDGDDTHELCGKVACFECQAKLGVYKGKSNVSKINE